MIAAVRPIRPDFSFLTGWEAALVPMLLMGCDGGTHASSGVVPEVTRKLYDLFRAGKLDDAVALQLKLIGLFDLMIAPDFPDGFRAGVVARGFDFARSPGHRPTHSARRGSNSSCCSRRPSPNWV